jgi:inhibitor of KinA
VAIAAAATRLRQSPPPGVLDIVPAYTTLTLHYDPAAVSAGATPYEALTEQVEAWLRSELVAPPPPGRVVDIPVCYGGRYGEDLEQLAHSHGLSPDEVAALHSSTEYHVHMLGFVPGFAYLGGLDPKLATPRRQSPRSQVPAGSVAIGGEQTGIYSLPTPGGWHLIGRTPLKLFTAEIEPPCLLNAGDTVRFVRISAREFEVRSGGGS